MGQGRGEGCECLFNSLNGVSESTDFIPESYQNAKTWDDYSDKKLK